jgi:hypothetical protein
MLIERGIGPERPMSCKVARDLPLELETGGVRSIDDLFYWRRTNTTHILEISIEASTGSVIGVEVVLVPPESRLHAPSVFAMCGNIEERRGIPLVDEAPWRARVGRREFADPMLRFVEEEGSFSLTLGDDGVAVTIEQERAVSKIVNGNVHFLFTRTRGLCAVVVALDRLVATSPSPITQD